MFDPSRSGPVSRAVVPSEATVNLFAITPIPRSSLAGITKNVSTKSRATMRLLPLTAFLQAMFPVTTFAADVKALEKALDPVVVTATRPALPSAASVDRDDARNDSVRDSAAMIESVPGAAVVRNGAQTGILQLRGLSQDRVKIRIDGMEISPACPNHMDPPMHYISPADIEAIQVTAGLTSVVQGGDSIAGTVTANTKGLRYSTSGGFEFSGRAKAGYSGANSGHESNLSFNLGGSGAALRYSGDTLQGGDLKYAGGTARLTGYDSVRHQLEGGIKAGDGEAGVSFGQHRSKDVGTPALGMDMIKDDAHSVRVGYNGRFNFGSGTSNIAGSVEARIYQHKIDHEMNNFTLRTYTPAAQRMKAPATSDDNGFVLGFTLPKGADIFRVGVDGHNNDFNVYQQSLGSGMIRDLVPNASRDRQGIYAELEAKPDPTWRTVLGLRHETVSTSASTVARSMGAGDAAERDAFNLASRDKTDRNWDLTATARHTVGSALAWEFGIARKIRSPSLIERYLWKPSSTYGSADGQNYLGKIDLKPEVSNQLAVSADWQQGGAYVKPTFFYNRVNDYIQGVAARSAANVAVLQFSNIRAQLHGIDGAFGYQLDGAWKLDGILSYVRGENRDNNDNLYRIAPLRMTLALEYNSGPWNAAVEGKGAARQTHVSAYNAETETGGWGILNLRAAYRFGKLAKVSVGIENLFDKFYADHLSGKNTVNNAALGGGLAIGQRVPNAGRFAYVSAEYSW